MNTKENMENHAILFVSYGGPEQMEDVVPFIKNVLAGQTLSEERINRVAQKYEPFDGISPVNEQCRSLMNGFLRWSNEKQSVNQNLILDQVDTLPVYWGNLFWHPMLEPTLKAMLDDGIRKVIAFCTVPFASPESFSRYTNAIRSAMEKLDCPELEIRTTRLFFNHPNHVRILKKRILTVLATLGDRGDEIPSFDDAKTIISRIPDPKSIRLIFSAHSLLLADDKNHCYQKQLFETAKLLDEALGLSHVGINWKILFQSRGGGPSENWLGPDVLTLERGDEKTVIICPFGFMLENMELLHDLDCQVARRCETLGLEYLRTETVGNAPEIIEMIRELVAESLSPLYPARYVGPPDIFPYWSGRPLQKPM